MSISEFVGNHEKEIKKCLNVYPEVFYGKAANEEIQKYVEKKIWKKNKKTANGYYNPDTNEVYIFNVGVSDDLTVGILAHELRHAYQYKLEEDNKNEHRKKVFNFPPHDYSLKDKYYECRKSELDANSFAYKYCKENKLEEKVIKYYKKKKEKIEKNRLKHKHSCP